MQHRCRGSQSLRYRLVLSHLANRPLRVDDIRVDDPAPGLRDHEACLLRLLEKVTNGTVVEINETGTRLRYAPGVVTGGAGLEHDCGSARSLGYFLEPLVCLALFAKKPLSITLRGVTGDGLDCSVDTWRAATLALLRRAGVGPDGLELQLRRRGCAPGGGGEVLLRVPPLREGLPALRLLDEGLVKRIRGTAFAERVAPAAANRLVDAARGVLNALLPDVYIFTDARSGQNAGASPGFGLSLVAETTTGCALAVDAASAPPRDGGAAAERATPEELGCAVAAALLEEVQRGGCVDSAHQPLALFLAAAGPPSVAQLRLGRLTPAAVRFLRELRDIAGLSFALEAHEASGTVVATCVGLGITNTARAVT